ncbi:hypothetical protein [Mycoplasma leonicaptivi]|uniref:hypothetical protein n=1 Tax=Mycoplasma leonicaptivi TaxID=36742 RepID=UPI0004828E32|nr:hypothetical protein [Mycoplasma leonicaptivi]
MKKYLKKFLVLGSVSPLFYIISCNQNSVQENKLEEILVEENILTLPEIDEKIKQNKIRILEKQKLSEAELKQEKENLKQEMSAYTNNETIQQLFLQIDTATTKQQVLDIKTKFLKEKEKIQDSEQNTDSNVTDNNQTENNTKKPNNTVNNEEPIDSTSNNEPKESEQTNSTENNTIPDDLKHITKIEYTGTDDEDSKFYNLNDPQEIYNKWIELEKSNDEDFEFDRQDLIKEPEFNRRKYALRNYFFIKDTTAEYDSVKRKIKNVKIVFAEFGNSEKEYILTVDLIFNNLSEDKNTVIDNSNTNPNASNEEPSEDDLNNVGTTGYSS